MGYCLGCKWDTTPKTKDNYLAMNDCPKCHGAGKHRVRDGSHFHGDGHSHEVTCSCTSDQGLKEKTAKQFKVELEFEVLDAIAKYYEFPVAVFFRSKESWVKDSKHTRLEELRRNSEILWKIKELIAEYEEGDER